MFFEYAVRSRSYTTEKVSTLLLLLSALPKPPLFVKKLSIPSLRLTLPYWFRTLDNLLLGQTQAELHSHTQS